MIDCLYFISQLRLLTSTYHSLLSLASIVWVLRHHQSQYFSYLHHDQTYLYDIVV